MLIEQGQTDPDRDILDIVRLIGRFSQIQRSLPQQDPGEVDEAIIQLESIGAQIAANPSSCMKALRAKALVVLEFTEEHAGGDLAQEASRALAKAVLEFLDD